MQIVTRAEIVAGVPDRFKHRHFNRTHHNLWNDYQDDNPVLESCYNALVAIASLTEEDVDRILGGSWINLACDECNKEVQVVVVVGKNMDQPAYLCIECVTKAHKLIAGE